MRVPAGIEGLQAHLRARTRFFDEQVLLAIENRISQIVLVGAGYDDRALRFPADGVRYFELDAAATQADKRRRLRRMGAENARLVLGQIELRKGDVSAVLADCGHDARRSSLFLCEGLFVYLDRPTITSLLRGLHRRATNQSRLVANLAIHRDGLDGDVVVRWANARRNASAREPWRTSLPADAHVALLRDAGWAATEKLDDTDLEADALAGRSLLVVASPHAGGTDDLQSTPSSHTPSTKD